MRQVCPSPITRHWRESEALVLFGSKEKKKPVAEVKSIDYFALSKEELKNQINDLLNTIYGEAPTPLGRDFYCLEVLPLFELLKRKEAK